MSSTMHSVVIHKYDNSHTAIEFGAESDKPTNFMVFIGGLTDGFLTVPYVPKLAEAISGESERSWVLVQALISSSYLGFGTGSLKRDAKELGRLVKYLRTNRGSQTSKVILMGHSTGCQDTMEFLTKHSQQESFDPLESIDAGILQAPVSDSEAFASFENGDSLEKMLDLARKHIDQGHPNELLPLAARKLSFGAPMSAYRFNSLAGQRGDDDYFSTYLSDDELRDTFGKVSKPLLVLYGEKDEFVPESVDRQLLIDRWRAQTSEKHWSSLSKVLKGASHNVGPTSDPGAEEDLIATVTKFVLGL